MAGLVLPAASVALIWMLLCTAVAVGLVGMSAVAKFRLQWPLLSTMLVVLVVLPQVTFGIAVRMAVMSIVAGNEA